MLESQNFGSARPIEPATQIISEEIFPGGGSAKGAAVADDVRTLLDVLGWPVVVLFVVLAVIAAACWFAPYLYAEFSADIEPHVTVTLKAPVLGEGRLVDGYWAIQKIDDRTYAIGEPRFYQANYTYLILGNRRAVLFDSGTGTRDIISIVRRLTKLPVTMIPSHLHYDHLGGAGAFSSIAMIDLPETRADVVGDRFVPGRYEFLGMADGRRPPLIHVTEWLKPGTRIDLGRRYLEVIHTPGHTSTSVSLFDPIAHQLFSGDFLYPTTLYAFLPGASLSAYQQTTSKLLDMLPDDTKIWAAHCCRVGERPAAPWLTMADVRALDSTLKEVAGGEIDATGVFPRLYPVDRELTLATGFPWNNR